MKVTVEFICKVQDHKFALVEGCLEDVMLLGNELVCKVGFLFDRLGP